MFCGSGELFALDGLGRAQAFGLLRPPSRSRDQKATVAKNCTRDRAEAPGAPVTTTGLLLQERAWPVERHDREHGGVAGGPEWDEGQAGASRATGRSTIGKLITADNRPSRIESHQTAS